MADNSLYKNVPKKMSFSQFVWNSETGELLGRTGCSWIMITIFYVVFYSFLAAFFSVMMFAFYQTLDPHFMPKYTPGDGQSILRNPAMGFRPLPRRDNIESTLIWYKTGDNDDIKHWTDSLDDFIWRYEGADGSISGQHFIDCTEYTRPIEDEVCRFQDVWLTDKCTKAEKWGYNRQSPCVLLKMNRMINWEPDVYQTMEELPLEMPQTLKNHIELRVSDNDGNMPKMIWVSCKAESPADEENIGDLTYSPWQGFPSYYFPFRNTPGYLPPIVAVQFNKLQSNVLIKVECRAWAKNINYDRGNRLGLVYFELLKD